VTNHMSSLCLASMVGCVLAGGSTGFGGHGHSSHESTHSAASQAPKAHHEAPKHSGGNPAHHAAPKSEAKPKEHDSHKHGAGNLPSGSKSHEHHDDRHHHRHGDHKWVGGVDVENGSGDGSFSDGTTGVVFPGDNGAGSAVVVPGVAGTGLSNRPQIQFSVDPAERDSYGAAAHAAGMSRSEWIRSRLNTAAGRELK
jgi:hypothetical protein